MIVSKQTDATAFENSPVCTGISYGGTGDAIDGATITVTGRYPERGYIKNEVCKELMYVISGQGTLLAGDETTQVFATGDVVFIDSGESFAWDGDFVGFFATTPRFNPGQYKQVEA